MGAVWIGEVELGRTFAPSGLSRAQRPDDSAARILVRLHHEVLGVVTIALSGDTVDAGMVAAAVRSQLAGPLDRHLEADGLTFAAPTSLAGPRGSERCERRADRSTGGAITVVVCTRDRADSLATCLKLLQQLEYEPFDVVIVDNASSTAATRDCFDRAVGDDPRFRYVYEPMPGLSRARNRGMNEASAPLVAFTDDDVQVDRWWLDGLVAGFAGDARAGCVTGLVSPIALDTVSQQYFDRRFGWGTRTEPQVYSLSDGNGVSSLHPYSAGLFGTGANFAVDCALLDALGGFDEALGAGSPAAGGEELDVFVRVLQAGRTVVYAPSAVVWHSHRRDTRALCRQVFHYGVGLTAFLSKYLADFHTAGEILTRVPSGARQIWRQWKPIAAGGRRPAFLVFTEMLGMLSGPVAYLRGRRLVRRS